MNERISLMRITGMMIGRLTGINYWFMREKIKDKGRLEHIMNAINGIMTDKELYSLEQVKSSTILFYDQISY